MIDALLKFQVPHEQGAAVRRAMVTAAAPARHLLVLYLDTADADLAADGFSLHLQQEGRSWTQVLSKADGAARRTEHAVPVRRVGGTPPTVDVQRHAHTALGEALLATLGSSGSEIAQQFQVRIERVQRIMRCGTSRIQLTFDRGTLHVGTAVWPICDLTFERLTGPQDGLVALTNRWIERHGLWFSDRGWIAMADEHSQAPHACKATLAVDSPLTSKLGADAGLRALVGNCLDQFFPNAARVAASTGEPAHLHQTRVALRRLRTALRVFGCWSEDVDPLWGATLDDVFRRLGASRDRDALCAGLLPALVAAGAPTIAIAPMAEIESPADLLKDRAINRTLLRLLAFSAGARPTRPAGSGAGNFPSPDPKLVTLVAPLLNQMHRQIARDAKSFLTLDDLARHRTRKRVKRLRYSIEFVARLFPSKAVARYLVPLRQAQDALGAFNDLTVADLSFRLQLEQDARAWFAVGWLAARRDTHLQACSAALRKLSKTRPFWTT